MKPEIIRINSRRGVLRASCDAIEPYLAIAVTLVGVHLWPLLAIPAVVVIGTRYRHINNLIHWASHSSLCSNPKFNGFLGNVLCASILFDFAMYRGEHSTHHRHIGDYTRDDDFRNVKDFQIGKSLTLQKRLKTIFRLRLFSAYSPKVGFGTRSQAVGVSIYFSIFMWLIIVSPTTAITLIVAMFFMYPLIRHLTDLVDHGGVYENENHMYQSRNFIIKNKVARWCFFPTNDCFHKVHHDYPFLSPWAQEEAHNYLAKNDADYAGMQHSWIDHIDSLLAQKPLRSLILD
jgi:fatty acid desaturase